MSITIRPDGSIITDNVAEAVALLKEQQRPATATVPDVPWKWDGPTGEVRPRVLPDAVVAAFADDAPSPSAIQTVAAVTGDVLAAADAVVAAPGGVVEGGPVADDVPETPAPPVKRSPRMWRQWEEERLQQWIRRGLSISQVADRLGRSRSSVNNKLREIEKMRDSLHLDPIREP